jgi:hypothetical protein
MRPLLSLSLAATLALGAIPAAHAARPTPHQLLDRALQPLQEQLAQIDATEAERREVADLLARGEALAAELMEARHRGATARAESLTRRIAWLARLARGQIEALRAEAEATAREQAALEAELQRVQARAALERAAERRLEAERAAETAPESPRPRGGQ